MAFSLVSWAVLAIIAGALWLALTKRFLAFGSLAVANILVHFVSLLGEKRLHSFDGSLVLVRPVVDDLALWPERLAAGDPAGVPGVVGHMFLHSGFSHLLGNMLILVVIGHYLEERIGGPRVVAAYLATGLVAAAAQLAVDWGNVTVMLGASGADFGLIGVLAAAYPRDRLRLPVPLIIIVFIPMQAWVAAIVFAVIQGLFMVVLDPFGGIAYWAHLGGLGGGLLLGWTIFYPRAKRARDVDWTPFATTAAAADALDRMRANRDEPSVHDAWKGRFLETARCPRCSTKPRESAGRLQCPYCNYDGTGGESTEPLRS